MISRSALTPFSAGMTGAAKAWHSCCTTIPTERMPSGRGGSGLGAAGIRDGLGFEIDTSFSGSRAGDIRTDHANFFDTDAAAGRGRITKAVNLGNIEDGRWHNVELTWDADTRTLVTQVRRRHVQHVEQ